MSGTASLPRIPSLLTIAGIFALMLLLISTTSGRAAQGEAAGDISGVRSGDPSVRVDLHGARAHSPALAPAFSPKETPGESPTSDLASPLRENPPPADWKVLGPFGGDAEAVAASPVSANLMLAGLAPSYAGNGKLFRSTNAGASWQEVSALAGNAVYDIAFSSDGTGSVGSVVCDPARPNVLYIARPDPDKVMISTDAGATFSPHNAGLTYAGSAVRLAYAGNPARLLLATTTGTCATFILEPASVDLSVAGDAGLRSTPNPARAGHSILFRAGPGKSGSLCIFDPAGRRVRTLTLAASDVVWDTRDDHGRLVDPGVYFARARPAAAAGGSIKIQVLR